MKTPFQKWNLLLTDDIIEEIVNCTNIYLQNIRAKFSRIRNVTDTDGEEVKPVFGNLYMTGILKSNCTRVICGLLMQPHQNFLS